MSIYDRRIAAKKQVDKIINHIRCDLEFDGTAQYYLTVLPPLLNKLSAAYEELTIAEAAAEAETRKGE